MWIKICGIRDELALRGAVVAGTDAVGFNFVSGSPRCVTVEQARHLVALLPATVTPVGLFCNQPVEFVLATARACGLRLVQLHGDESVAEATQVAREFPLLRSFNWSDLGLAPLATQLGELSATGVEPWGILVDGPRAGARTGGTGNRVDWPRLACDWGLAARPRLILAGGLNPANVAEAVSVVHPDGVDVASGVETAPGVKDPELMLRFCEATRAGRPVRV